jgi:hypothetical protein
VGGGIPCRCGEEHPFHSDAVRSSDISLGRSEGFRHLIPVLRGASHFLPRRGGVAALRSDAMRRIPFHWDAVRSSDIILGPSEGFRHPTPMPRGHPLPPQAVRRCGLPFRCDRRIPFHPDALRSSVISLGHSGGFRHFPPMLWGASHFPPEALRGRSVPFRCDEEHPFHSDAVRSSDISLGRSEGF